MTTSSLKTPGTCSK